LWCLQLLRYTTTSGHVIMGVFGILPNSPLGHQSCDHCPSVIHGGISSELLTSGEISYQSSHNQIKGLLITSNANCSIRQFGVGEELCPMSSSLSHFRRLFSSPCQRQSMWGELLPSLGVRRPLTFHILIFWTPLKPLTGLSQMNWNLVGSIYGRSSIKCTHFVPIH
jgi:hypothetical protein